jgi:hypothetical protein
MHLKRPSFHRTDFSPSWTHKSDSLPNFGVNIRFKEHQTQNTSGHNMGPAGYTVKLPQWEEENRQLAAAGIPNPYDAYPDDHSKNWLHERWC